MVISGKRFSLSYIWTVLPWDELYTWLLPRHPFRARLQMLGEPRSHDTGLASVPGPCMVIFPAWWHDAHRCPHYSEWWRSILKVKKDEHRVTAFSIVCDSTFLKWIMKAPWKRVMWVTIMNWSLCVQVESYRQIQGKTKRAWHSCQGRLLLSNYIL